MLPSRGLPILRRAEIQGMEFAPVSFGKPTKRTWWSVLPDSDNRRHANFRIIHRRRRLTVQGGRGRNSLIVRRRRADTTVCVREGLSSTATDSALGHGSRRHTIGNVYFGDAASRLTSAVLQGPLSPIAAAMTAISLPNDTRSVPCDFINTRRSLVGVVSWR